MKRYIFEKGSITGELTGEDIKKHEEKFGRLQGILVNGKKIMCQYDVKQIPVEDLWLFKEKKK